VAIALVVCSVTVAGQGLDELKAGLDRALAKVKADYAQTLRTIGTQYPNALDRMLENMIQDGDLDGVLAVRKEKKRLEEEQTVPTESPADLLQGIKDARADYHRTIAAAEEEMNSHVLTVHKTYVKHLNKLVKQFTSENKLEQAMAVNDELARASAELDGIRSDIAEAEAPCRECKGNGKIVKQCYYCEGTGRCSKCRGKGRISKRGAKRQSSTVIHALCRGTGKCPRCKGKGQEEILCRSCNGSGLTP
jgi:hypothetical protein